MATDAMSIGPFPHKSLIPVAFGAAEIEIAMRNSKAFTRITADIDLCHTHGIYAAAYRKKGRFILHYFLDASVQVKPNRSDSLNCTLCFVSPSTSLKIMTLSS